MSFSSDPKIYNTSTRLVHGNYISWVHTRKLNPNITIIIIISSLVGLPLHWISWDQLVFGDFNGMWNQIFEVEL